MTKNTYIENYISYQKSTDKSPATLTSYRSDLIQFATRLDFVSINFFLNKKSNYAIRLNEGFLR